MKEEKEVQLAFSETARIFKTLYDNDDRARKALRTKAA